MRARGLSVAALALAIAASPRASRAGGGPGSDSYEGVGNTAPIEAHGYADVYAQDVLDGPTRGLVPLRAFDTTPDAPALGLVRVTLARRPRVVGFRVELGAGDTTEAFARQDPATSSAPAYAAAVSHVTQAFASLALPVARGLAIDGGRFATPMGLEDNESLSNWNESRSLLYTWAEPTLHTGLRASLHVTRALALSAWWVNGWDTTVLGGNGMQTGALGFAWTPSDAVELDAVWMAGPERAPTRLADPRETLRSLATLYATVRPVRGLALALAADRGDDAAGASWSGIAVYARAQPRPWVAATARVELLSDPQGFVTGTAQAVAEATGTLELERRAGALRLLARLEYRHDGSTAAVFVRSQRPASTQDSVALALLAAF